MDRFLPASTARRHAAGAVASEIPRVNIPKTMGITRFVILHHREHGGEHWDLMIEQSAGLATWRLARMPAAEDHAPIPATRLPDHRKAYLEYEGPISRDRGEVRRVEEGACEILEQAAAGWRVVLRGARLSGRFVLRCDELCRDEEDANPPSPA